MPRLFGGVHTEVNEATGRLESGKATEGRAQVRRPVTRRMPQSREEDWPKHRRYLPDLSGTAVSRDEYDPTPWGVVAPPSCLDALYNSPISRPTIWGACLVPSPILARLGQEPLRALVVVSPVLTYEPIAPWDQLAFGNEDEGIGACRREARIPTNDYPTYSKPDLKASPSSILPDL